MDSSLSNMLTGIADTATVLFITGAPDERYNLTTIPVSFKQFEGAINAVRIGNIVTAIDSDAFYFCESMVSAIISNRVTDIGSGSFAYTGLTSITIPKGVTSVSNYVFQGSFDLSVMNCFVTRTIINQAGVLDGTAFPFTINARASDATWTAGPDVIGGQIVTVVKNL
jgi:hypothetical protein